MYHMIAFMHIQDFDGFFLSSEQAKTENVLGVYLMKTCSENISQKKNVTHFYILFILYKEQYILNSILSPLRFSFFFFFYVMILFPLHFHWHYFNAFVHFIFYIYF